VAGSTSAKQASANPDLRAAARQIGVDALLQGSVRADDKKIRVTVRLVDGNTGAAIWSRSFDGERAGLFDLVEKIARAIAAKLAIQLAIRRGGVDVRTAPRRAQAYEYCKTGSALVPLQCSVVNCKVRPAA
jgi:adenylate cyclase